MALKENFYTEIFEKEKYWLQLANNKLLNIYYINGKNGIRDFYFNAKGELEQEYQQNGNQIIKGILDSINKIIEKIDFITLEHTKGKDIDSNSIVNLFLSNQMNNNLTSNKNTDKISHLKSQIDLLKNMKYSTEILNESKNIDDDYLYDDFPEESKKII